jgi:hypothetical protein
MGSFKVNEPDRNPERRRRSKSHRRNRTIIDFESLENRQLLAFPGSGPPTWQPTDLQNPLDAHNGPLANAGPQLIRVYQDYQSFKESGKPLDFFQPSDPTIVTRSGLVGVTVSVYGDTAGMATALSDPSIGMFVTQTDTHFGLIAGYVAPSSLIALARFQTTINGQPAGVVNLQPIQKPVVYGSSTQAVQGFQLPAALAQYPGTTGAGVTMGILSDSVNRVGGGIASSISAGALPPANRINVIQDGPVGATDEGRAMMEVAYDIAPGANYAFNTASGGQLAMASGIQALSTAGAQVIVDDIGYPQEPAFQPGPIDQAISSVVNSQNRVYFSAAGNMSNNGYMSTFRSATDTIAGNTGTFMNFNPSGGVLTQLPVNVVQGGFVEFQFDQPWFTSNGVKSEVDIYFLNSAGTVVASGTANNVATQQAYQAVDLTGINNTALTMAMFVRSGPAPAHVFTRLLGSGNVQFSTQFGTAGGTSYPTTSGHNAPVDGIGVGAVDVRNVPPFSTTQPIPSEPFTSNGPRMLVYDASGNPLSTGPQVLQRPQISSLDGINTTFFGQIVGSETLPSFFGTSCATPDAGALAVLMRQLSPGTPEKGILNALIDSTISINGKPAGLGNWDVVGGSGLIQAPRAFNDISQLRVNSSTPANGDVLTSLGQLQTVTFDFNKPVNATSVTPSALVFSNLPTGVTVNVTGVTVAGSTAVFSVQVTHLPGDIANGSYTFALGGQIVAADGKSLLPYKATFTVADTINPTILGTTLIGRTVAIQFSEPMDPSTITPANIKILRGSSLGIDLSLIPGYSVKWFANYNGQTNVALIDLSALPQTQLPTDRYAISVSDATTDLVGNALDGDFNGVFPTGADGLVAPFLQDLGVVTLQAPFILSLDLAPASDTGIVGDHNTKVLRPTFSGQVSALFPQAIAGLQVVVQFNSLHNNVFDLVQGDNGRGFKVSSSIDVETTTDAHGNFSFTAPANLPNGFQIVRVIVVGQADSNVLPGLSTLHDQSFRIDTTNPLISPVGITQGAQINNLDNGLELSINDPVLPNTPSPLGVPLQFQVPALNPATANNVSNYTLTNIGSLDGTTTTSVDYSSYIISAVYTDTTNRTSPLDPYTGQVELKFAPGLPAGHYVLKALASQGTQSGITDAAGNPIDGNPNQSGASDMVLNFDLQPTPSFVTNLQALSPDANGNLTVITGPKDFYEIPVPGVAPRAPAPPTRFYIDFSGPLNPTLDYSNRVWLIRSADSANGPADGNFGTDPTFSTAGGFTRVTGLTIKLVNSILGATYGQPGYKNRLEIDLAPGTTLPADYYRIYIPNAVINSQDLRISDLYGNVIDGEFLGNPTATGGWEDLLPNGQYRPGMSGDGTAGGSFETSLVVAPNGNVIYARPDYTEDPFLPNTFADGSPQKPYPVLAPEALPTAQNGGDLNNPSNFGTGFNPNIDISGSGHFDLSAFYAASQLSNKGPVVIVAEPANPGDPLHRTFVLREPNQNPSLPTIPDGSASLPADTMLVMEPGSILKMYDASLFVQNQGTAIQLRGGANPSQQVVVTSYYDSSAGGNTANAGVGVTPNAGDFGGIVLRNFDDTSKGGRAIPEAPGPDDPSRPNLYGRTKLGVSGADEALSYINFTQIRYAGGAVPNTLGFRFDAITLFNARPSITNTVIDGKQPVAGDTGPNGGSQAGIGANMDSLREDPLARGVLVRRTTVSDTSINGIYVRAELNGVIEPTNAVFYADNAPGQGGLQNYTMDDPLPYVFTARMVLGRQLQQSDNLAEVTFSPRLYVQPGMMIKFQRGAAIDILSTSSSLNIGDRTYINEFDQNPSVAPTDPGFKPEPTTGARVVLTSFFDDNATTQYVDPITGVATQIVAPLDSDNGGPVNLPTPGNVPALARWGSIAVIAGARVVINDADIRYGGGTVNESNGTIAQRDVLHLDPAPGSTVFGVTTGATGQRIYITNNNFTDNQGAPVDIDANGLLAADPLRPLQSGNPFLRGNIMQRNDINGMEVYGSPNNRSNTTFIGYPANLFVNSVWDLTDVTYVLQTTIVLSGTTSFPTPPSTFGAVLPPYLTLTLQSNLPGTLLANGETIAKPGEPLLVKLLNDTTVPPVGDGVTGMPAANVNSDTRGGAGFLVGFDDGVDGTPDLGNLIDPGMMSQIRITGIGGNETTGQQRVPVILTSLRDNSVGKTVRGVTMNQGASPAYLTAAGYTGTTPQAGDGGIIGFGANSLSDFNLLDPRNGNIIDNADINYMTRIDIQGGGWAYSWGTTPALAQVDATTQGKTGLVGTPDGSPDPWFQYNTSKAMTISDSNLANFSQIGVIDHPSGNAQIHDQKHPAMGTPAVGRGGFPGEPVTLYMVNDTLANMPTGVRINSDTQDNVNNPSPYTGIFQNNTFYNTPVGIHAQAPQYDGMNSRASTYILGLDNIFANNTTAGVQVAGQSYSSQLLYNLFSNTPNPIDIATAQFEQGPFNAQPVIGNASFVDAANLNFNLNPDSDAIDASLSEVKQSNWGTYLQPIANQTTDGTLGTRNMGGRAISEPFGGIFNVSKPGDIVTLPGFPANQRGYFDQWVPVLAGTPGSSPGSTDPDTYAYMPISGERDLRGYLRVDDPNRANVGFGSRPFFDIGAYEYRQLIAPQVTDVVANLPDPANTPIDPADPNTTRIYVAGGIGGVNQAPDDIRISLSQQIDPTTLSNMTVLLQASGGDGIFGNGNNSQDRFISLSGKLSYDPGAAATATTAAVAPAIIVHLGDLGLTLTDDLYRITILGTGNDVIRNSQGLALDGEDTPNADPNGVQQALPSGNGIPGGNFFVTFVVKTAPPSIVKGTLALASGEGKGPNLNITKFNEPTFVGTIFDTPPPVNPLVGQTVIIDVSTKGYVNGKIVFDVPNAGTGTTDGNGNFSVTLTTPLPDSAYNVGPDGILGTADDSGYSVARVRIISPSGAASNPNDPNAQFSFDVDTKGPKVTGTDPVAGTKATVTGGVVPVAIVTSENIDPASLNSTTIKVLRSGGDGIFGNGNDQPVAIDPSSIQETYLKTPLGAAIIRFNLTGITTNDIYQVTLVGAGSPGVTDLAGNLIDGATPNGLPSGNGTNGDFNLQFIVLDPNLTHTLYVDASQSNASPTGTRTDAFSTIGAAMSAAGIGDTVAVVGGSATSSYVTYTETVTMKPLVQLVSADPSSTNTNLVPGIALKTVIRPLLSASPSVAIIASNLLSLPGYETRISGFSIANPLTGGTAFGPIQASSIGILDDNSDMQIDRNIILTSGTGVEVMTQNLARAPELYSNVITGNLNGIILADINGSTTGFQGTHSTSEIVNNTITWNTNGLLISTDAGGPLLADVVNNIFWQNADRTVSRNGEAITSNFPNRITVQNNLFSANGPSISSPADDTVNVGNGFNPALLLPTKPDALGNFTGNPAFVSPIDPRPAGQGPGNFFLGANYDLTAVSAAIDKGSSQAVTLSDGSLDTDFLYRTRVNIPNVGFSTAGIVDVGAFEFDGLNAQVTVPISSVGFSEPPPSTIGLKFGAGVTIVSAATNSITFRFSGTPNRSSVQASDLLLSGSALRANNPAHATSVTWIDSRTVRFNFTGSLIPKSRVEVDFAPGALRNANRTLVPNFSKTITVPNVVTKPSKKGHSKGSKHPVPKPPVPKVPHLTGLLKSLSTRRV